MFEPFGSREIESQESFAQAPRLLSPTELNLIRFNNVLPQLLLYTAIRPD